MINKRKIRQLNEAKLISWNSDPRLADRTCCDRPISICRCGEKRHVTSTVTWRPQRPNYNRCQMFRIYNGCYPFDFEEQFVDSRQLTPGGRGPAASASILRRAGTDSRKETCNFRWASKDRPGSSYAASSGLISDNQMLSFFSSLFLFFFKFCFSILISLPLSQGLFISSHIQSTVIIF